MELPSNYLEEMKELLGDQYEAYLASFEQKTRQGLRVNTAKIAPETFRQKADISLECVPWCENGFAFDEKQTVTKHPYYYAGLYYVQEPSAMIPASHLPIEPGDFVLDLCAAPGGKATELGAKLKGKGMLLANDISNSRAKGLLKNLELFGISNLFVSSEESDKLKKAYPAYFDKILIDAPCSGEGMFRRDKAMVKDWLQKGPDYYVPIQRKLLLDAADMLKKGGNAVDAAIAAAITLTVTEPTSNGIGSDTFALVWMNDSLHGLNGSGWSPAEISLEKVRAMGHETMPERGWTPVNIPGTPSSVATCFDGKPMANKGEAGKALGSGVVFSFVGTIIGIGLLVVLSPVLCGFALEFQAYEYCALAIFSLSMVIALTGHDMPKGLVSAVLGSLLATVGLSPIDSKPRFTFGLYQLNNGFALVVLLIGLFAIAEVMSFAESVRKGQNFTVETDYKIKGAGFSLKEGLAQTKNAIVSALIGVGIGILPGIGGGVSCMISYTVSKNTSKHREL